MLKVLGQYIPLVLARRLAVTIVAQAGTLFLEKVEPSRLAFLAARLVAAARMGAPRPVLLEAHLPGAGASVAS